MAKTIKFNLICDEKPVRTIEDLQNNFSIEDVLEYYDNGLLLRWLYVRGYDKEFKAVSAIQNKDSMKIIEELIRIFEVVTDEKQVEKSIYMLQYLNERRKLYNIYKQENNNVTHIIDDYEMGYRKLVNGILENPDDVARIKANIADIVSNYAWILRLNRRELFYDFLDKGFYLAIMCLLMNEDVRKYYIPIVKANEDGSITATLDDDRDAMYEEICRIIISPEFRDKLGENLYSFKGVTDEYWKDLEPKGKKYMIVSMDSGDFVRSAGVYGADLDSNEVTNKFVIIDGIDYKSNSDWHELLYMEV